MSTIKIIFHSIHFDADAKLEAFIEERVQKLVKMSDQVIEAEIFLKLENDSNLENKVVEIKLVIPGNDLFAKKNSRTFEEATDSTIEALRRQLKKRKEKIWGN
ncbi:MAG: HPF/RaiA family ribosome-associated protein [Vicingaceae bacterium]